MLLFSQKIKLTGFKLAGKETVRDLETNLVTFDLNIPDKKTPIRCKLWLDAKTNMPLKRSLEFTMNGKAIHTGVETYSRWEIDPKIEEGTFTLPK